MEEENDLSKGELIELIKKEHSNIEVAFAPAYNELESAKNIKCINGEYLFVFCKIV